MQDREASEESRRRHCHSFFSFCFFFFFFFYKLLVKLIEPTFSEKISDFHLCTRKWRGGVREKIHNLYIVYPSGIHPVLGCPLVLFRLKKKSNKKTTSTRTTRKRSPATATVLKDLLSADLIGRRRWRGWGAFKTRPRFCS